MARKEAALLSRRLTPHGDFFSIVHSLQALRWRSNCITYILVSFLPNQKQPTLHCSHSLSFRFPFLPTERSNELFLDERFLQPVRRVPKFVLRETVANTETLEEVVINTPFCFRTPHHQRAAKNKDKTQKNLVQRRCDC